MVRNGLYKEKAGNMNFVFAYSHLVSLHYGPTLEVADSQSWPNYRGPKRKKGQVCLTKQCLHPFPSRWRDLESPLFLVWPSPVSRLTTLYF